MIDKEQVVIRVYGILINSQSEVLLADEYWFGQPMTKFPGGGLIPGEGTIDCLKREFLEELGLQPHNIRHFYTTDFFQSTELLVPSRQLLSIYYQVDLQGHETIGVKSTRYDFDFVEGSMVFRWVPLSGLTSADVTFPIDKKVVSMLVEKFRH
jgi:8-oxo-dGTP diphosphatase